MGLPVIEQAKDLPPEARELIFELICDYPPFGFHRYILRHKVERRLGVVVTPEAVLSYLSRYYDLDGWRERYLLDLMDDVEVDAQMPDAEMIETYFAAPEDGRSKKGSAMDDGGAGGEEEGRKQTEEGGDSKRHRRSSGRPKSRD